MSINNKQVKLGDVLVSLKTGLNPRSNFKLNTPGARNWYITVRELNGTGVDFLPQTDRVDDEALMRINSRSNLEVGDVLFSATGTIGKTAIVSQSPKNWNIKEGVYVLKPNKKLLDPYFLLCQLRYYSDIGVFNNQIGGSTVFSVPMSLLLETTFQLPSLDIQKQISTIVKNINHKIELNNKINAELEQMAETLYDYWFVQFDFPDANGKPYKSSGGAMVYNEELKREIPKDWEVKNLNQIADIIMGQSPPGTTYNTNGNGSVFFQGSTEFGTRHPVVEQYTTAPSRFAKKGDILLSVRAPVGSMNIADRDCCIGRGLAALRNKSGSQAYLFEVMRYFKQIFDRQNSGGTTFGSITKDGLHDLKVAYPGDLLVSNFEQAVGSTYSMQNINGEENQKLAELRDWLLPMLMNGQVTVKQVQGDKLITQPPKSKLSFS